MPRSPRSSAAVFTHAAVACLALTGAAPALAQSTTVYGGVAPYVVDVGGWAMTPVVTKTGNGPWTVHSFLAINKAPAGQNLRAVWYVRDSKSTCDWTAKTWDTNDAWDAIKYVKQEVSIPDDYDTWWATATVVSATSSAMSPELYTQGFKQNDPWGVTIAATEARDAWVEWLEQAGYKCANIPFEKYDASNDPKIGQKTLSANAETLDSLMAQPGTPPPRTTPVPGPGAPPTPAGPLPMPTTPSPFPTPPPPSPVVPTSLPGGTPPPARTLPCCTPGTGIIFGFWSSFIEKKNWAYDASCSTFQGAPPYPLSCCYSEDVCQYRQVIAWTITPACVLTTTISGVEERCFKHSFSCDNVNGLPSCPAATPPTIPCSPGPGPAPAVPPTGTPLTDPPTRY